MFVYLKYFQFFILFCIATSFTNNDVDLPILDIDAGTISQSILTPDGESVLMASGSQILVWDIYKKQILQRYTSANSDVVCMSLSKDGAMLAAGFESGEIAIWDALTFKVIHTFSAHKNKISAIHIDANFAHLASGDESGTIKTWDLNEATLIHQHHGHEGKINALDISLDGKLLLSAGDDQMAMLWKFDEAEVFKMLMGHLSAINTARFLNETTVLTGSNDKTISAWDIQTGEIAYTLVGHKKKVIGLELISNKNQFVSMSEDQHTIIWNANTMKEVDQFEVKDQKIKNMSLSGSQLLRLHNDYSITLGSLTEPKKVETIQIKPGPILAGVVSKERDFVMSGNEEGFIKKHLLSNGDLVQYFKAHEKGINQIAMSLDGTLVASASEDKLVKIWDADSGELLHTLEGHKANVLSVEFSPEGQFLYTAGKDKFIKWWNLSSGVEINSFKAHSADITQLIPMADNKVLSVSKDRSINICLAEKGSIEFEIGVHRNAIKSAVYIAKDSLLYIGDELGFISTYHTGQHKMISHLKIHSATVSHLCLSEDNQYLLSSSADKTSSLLHRSSEMVDQIFSGHQAGLSFCTFGKDEKTIITASLDGQIKVWSIQDIVQR